jgi:HD superfamily phosphohydrolase
MYARESMYHNCYEHPRKRVAEQLFQGLVEELVERHGVLVDDLYALTDDEVLAVVKTSTTSEKCRHLLEHLMSDVDYVSVHEVSIASAKLSADVKNWVELTRAERSSSKSLYLQQPANWAEAIASRSIGVGRSWQIQVLVPSPRNYRQQHSAARILVMTDGGFESVEFLDRLEGIKPMFESMDKHRNKISVVCPSTLSSEEFQAVRRAAIQELEG